MGRFLAAIVPRTLRAILTVFALAAQGVEVAAEEQEAQLGPWAVTLWGGWALDGDIAEIPGVSTDTENSWFVGLGVNWEFARTGKHFAWELEGIVAKHFGWQDHVEGDIAVVLRWDGFPWNDRVYTTAAMATGVSFTSRLPVMEEELDPSTKRFLHFLGFEATFARPSRPDLSAVLGLHHRSAAFGLYGTKNGGSNFISAGLRKRF